MKKEKILIVDDEQDIIELVQYNLQKEGYEIITAPNGRVAVQLAEKHHPQLILMDIMMPVMDGIEACRLMRTNTNLRDTFIVFLTAREEEYSEIAGFDVGADDYITKPIKPRALVSRINAILKRGKGLEEEPLDRIEIADLLIDRDAYNVVKDGIKISLPKKEFELLYLLAKKPGKVFTRESILNQVWEDSVIVSNRTIDVHIRKLREKIGEHYVSTVKGVGYKFDA
ncbi:MAG: two-component system alkaline phosphatase synthesis response regulator PhoP [Sphingobacteriales bacterium]|jgi:two-component system alkaline phosphatase synthesis response regulator PhoP